VLLGISSASLKVYYEIRELGMHSPHRSSQSTIISSRSLIPSAPPPAARLILAGSTLISGSTARAFPFLDALGLAFTCTGEVRALLELCTGGSGGDSSAIGSGVWVVEEMGSS